MKTLFRGAMVSLVLFVLCGIIYPLAMTGISQVLFNKQANGSQIQYNGKVVGSELLGQNVTDTKFFHGRISAVNYNTYKPEDKAYTGVASGSANLAPSNPALVERVKNDIEEFLKANPTVKKEDIPTDLLTSSGSGLDPDVSPKSAFIQIPAISKATGISTSDLKAIVDKNTEGRFLGIFGEPRVNLLSANIEIKKRLE